jgi:hypothetical protein
MVRPGRGHNSPTRFRCRYCRSPRLTVDFLAHAEQEKRLRHHGWCRTRWDDIARQACDLDVEEFLNGQGVWTPDYGWTPTRHAFVQVMA